MGTHCDKSPRCVVNYGDLRPFGQHINFLSDEAFTVLAAFLFRTDYRIEDGFRNVFDFLWRESQLTVIKLILIDLCRYILLQEINVSQQ